MIGPVLRRKLNPSRNILTSMLRSIYARDYCGVYLLIAHYSDLLNEDRGGLDSALGENDA